MGRWNDKYVIGLTGNIAMGKSLVRRMLEHLGAYTLDADGLAHQVMAPNAPAYAPVVEMFGKFVVNPDGQIDRNRLGAIAFSHPDALSALENITHPIISAAIDTLVTRAKHKVVVVEAIKLLEGDLATMVDSVWVVDSTPETQVARLMEKRGLTELEARKRVTIQNPQSIKIDKATVVIKNNGTPEETWSQVQAAWHKIGKGDEDTQAIEAVQTVKVTPQQPQPPAAPAAPQTASAPATPTQPAAPITSIDIKRPRPGDFDNIAKLINQETGSSITRNDIMATFGEKTYMLAEANSSAIGIIGFLVENLVTRVDEFIISRSAPLDAVGKALIEAMERASDELQSEIAFVFLAPEAEAHKTVFKTAGYDEMSVAEIRYPAWREAINEYKPENKVLLSRRLRENLVLKPI